MAELTHWAFPAELQPRPDEVAFELARALDALVALRVDIKAEVKSSQFQLLLWLSGIVLASNGIVIALLGRLAHIY